MKIARPLTEKWHNYEEGDCGSPINNFFKKGDDRKKFFRKILNFQQANEYTS